MLSTNAYHHLPDSGSQVDLSDMSRVSLSKPDHRGPPAHSSLKPMFLANAHRPGATNGGYAGLSSQDDLDDIVRIQQADEALKRRIRLLRVVTRMLSLLLAIAAFVPLALTLHKFLSTQHVYREAGGKLRTAWALKTKSWPTYLYFAVALASLLLNVLVLLSYACGVRAANRAATVGTVFTWLTLAADVGIWFAAVVIYRYEKEVVEDGKHNDLWGWTCSPAARSIQKVFKDEVPFDRFCNVQTAGWVAGLLQVGLLLLTGVVYLLVFRRRKTKRTFRRRTAELRGGFQ